MNDKQPILINFYTRKQCPLCDKAKLQIEELQLEIPIEINEIDIYEHEQFLEKYQLMIPVVEIAGELVAYGQIFKEDIKDYLASKNI